MKTSHAPAAGSLTSEQTNAYWDDGFVFPIRVMSKDQAAHMRTELEYIEREGQAANLPRPLKEYIRVHSDCVLSKNRTQSSVCRCTRI